VSGEYGPFRRVLYRFFWLFGNLLIHVWFGKRVVGRPRPFPDGPLIVAANHVSYLDPVLLALAVPRRVTYLVTSAVFDRWPFRPWMWIFGAIRVRDDTVNVDAMRRAIAALGRGEVVGIFPEGGISRDGRISEGAIGVASLLKQGGAPVLTAGLVGTFDALPFGAVFPRPRRRLEVRFSDRIDPGAVGEGLTPRDARRELRDRVMASIARVLPERMQRLPAAARQSAASPPR